MKKANPDRQAYLEEYVHGSPGTRTELPEDVSPPIKAYQTPLVVEASL